MATINANNNSDLSGITVSGGTVSINSGTSTLGISTDASATTVSIATGGAVKGVTLGSTSSTSSTAIKSGSGNIVLNSGLTVDSTGRMHNSVQPLFSAYLGTNVTNATGNGTTYTLGSTQALTIEFDQNSNMNTNGTFTAPVTGKYFFNCGVLCLNTVAANVGQISFTATAVTKNTYVFGLQNSSVGVAAYGFNGTAIIPMTAGDTCTFVVNVYGEATARCTIQGAQTNTWISGYLIA